MSSTRSTSGRVRDAFSAGASVSMGKGRCGGPDRKSRPLTCGMCAWPSIQTNSVTGTGRNRRGIFSGLAVLHPGRAGAGVAVVRKVLVHQAVGAHAREPCVLRAAEVGDGDALRQAENEDLVLVPQPAEIGEH